MSGKQTDKASDISVLPLERLLEPLWGQEEPTARNAAEGMREREDRRREGRQRDILDAEEL